MHFVQIREVSQLADMRPWYNACNHAESSVNAMGQRNSLYRQALHMVLSLRLPSMLIGDVMCAALWVWGMGSCIKLWKCLCKRDCCSLIAAAAAYSRAGGECI